MRGNDVVTSLFLFNYLEHTYYKTTHNFRPSGGLSLIFPTLQVSLKIKRESCREVVLMRPFGLVRRISIAKEHEVHHDKRKDEQRDANCPAVYDVMNVYHRFLT